MVNYLTHGLIIGFIYFQCVVLIIILSNILILHRRRSNVQSLDLPSVSMLVPARNEEKCIEGCIQSLVELDYPAFEVISLDDQSSDGTLSILEHIAKRPTKIEGAERYSNT